MKEYLNLWMKKLEISNDLADYLSSALMIISLVFLVIIIDYIIKKIVIKIASRAAQKSKNFWDDVLLEQKFFHRVSHIVPALLVYEVIPFAFTFDTQVENLMMTIIQMVLVIIFVQISSSILNTVNIIYNSYDKNKSKSIKGYIQVAKIIIIFIAGIVIFSILTGKNALTVFAGLGAFAAILILIFQDAIKGLVSGVQISTNDMVRIGDWISVPKYNADGTVIEIALTTVKVQNWDYTISMIPSYALVSDSFSNWRGMEESGGRRIKRSIFIDVNSIHFLTEEEKKELKEIHILEKYLTEMDSALNEYNSTIAKENKTQINGRKLTNIGTFRRYLEEYIRINQHINHNMTFMVRQLQSSEKGLPIEIYAFSKVKAWIEYEKIQADIFDHIFAAISTFNLKIFQNPTGGDFKSLGK